MISWIIVVVASVIAVIALKKRRSALMRHCKSLKNLNGQFVIVTGASSGLGRELSLELVKRDANVVMACRDLAKCQAAVRYITGRFQSSQGRLYPMKLDLSSLESVERFVHEYCGRFGPVLDILVNNAGVMACPFSLSELAPIETQFVVNHLGHFYLTELVLPFLEKSNNSGRIVILSSGLYRQVKVADFTKPCSDPMDGYRRSKLANCLHGYMLARELNASQSNVSAYVVRPGFVRGTELGRHYNALLRRLATPWIWFFSNSLDVGVQTVLHGCLSDHLTSGCMYKNCQKDEFDQRLVNATSGAELMKLSRDIIEKYKIRRRDLNRAE